MTCLKRKRPARKIQRAKAKSEQNSLNFDKRKKTTQRAKARIEKAKKLRVTPFDGTVPLFSGLWGFAS